MVARLLRADWYERECNGFVDYAFKPSSGRDSSVKGISVVDLECISDTNTDLCEYIKNSEYFSSFEPPILAWVIPDGILPENHKIVKDEEGVDADPCHRNIINVSANKSKKLFKKEWKDNRSGFKVCDENGLRELSEDDIANF